MRGIPYELLVIPDDCERKPTSGKKLEVLGQRILVEGLKYPPIVRVDADGTFMLLVGARRAKALRLLAGRGETVSCFDFQVPNGTIPVIALSDLNLSDDGDRVSGDRVKESLTWQQKVAAIAEIMKLRSYEAVRATYYAKLANLAVEIKGHDETPTKEEIEYVRQAVSFASHLDEPDYSQAQSLHEAFELRRQQAAKEMAELRAAFEIRKAACSSVPTPIGCPTSSPVSAVLGTQIAVHVPDSRRSMDRSPSPTIGCSTKEQSPEADYFAQRFSGHLRLFSKSLDDKGSCSRARAHQRENFWGIEMGSFLSELMAEGGFCFSEADLWVKSDDFPDHLAEIPPEDIPNFLCALFYLILIDQVIFAHHREHYIVFQLLTNCPKMDCTIGWARPMMMSNPYAIFREQMRVGGQVMGQSFRSWAKFIVADMEALFNEHDFANLAWDDVRRSMMSDGDCFAGGHGGMFRQSLTKE